MRAAALFVLVAFVVLVGGCSDGAGDTAHDTVVDRTRAVPADVRAFLDRVADPAIINFTADYELLNKNGGREHTIHVDSPPLGVTIDGNPVDLTDEPSLVPFGIFSGFLAENPKAAIEAAARRADAGPARFSTQRAASSAVECVEIPVQDAVTAKWCLTTEGIFGLVDTPSARYELTEYTVD